MSLTLDEHRNYLDDPHRISAFRRAIDATVRPGDVVVDLGCGTGILGLMACRARASRVYAIDASGMIDVARRAAADNGYADRIVHIQNNSMRVTLPEPADVVVCDQIGHLGFEAGVMPFFADAARRFLRPGGQLLPVGVTTWCAPIEAPPLSAEVEFWRTTPAGFDFSAVATEAANSIAATRFEAGQLLAAAAPVLHVVCGEDAPAVKGAASFEVTRPGVLSGMGGWFVAQLTDTVTMTNAPGAVDQIARRQAFLPLGTPARVERGDQIEVVVRARPVELVVAWDVRVMRGGVVLAHTRQSTLAAMLVPRETLARTNPASRPQLSARAQARATVLGLCDGRHTLADIETLTARLHPTLFATAGAAQEFVAEVVTVYGKDDGQ